MRIIQTANLKPDSLSPDDQLWAYNGLDCCVTLEVLEALHPQLDNVSGATYAFSKALQAPILEMSIRGVRIDQHRRAEVLSLRKHTIERLSDQLSRIVREGVGVTYGDPHWWRSPAKLSNLLYDVLRLPPVKKRNSAGIYTRTVNHEALEHLQQYLIAEPIVNHLLALRDLEKQRQFLETKIDPDGRIRTSFNIAGTKTGRLASSMSEFGTGGNLQNIDRELRSVFVADPGMKFCNIDLEQADSRNLGALCWEHFVAERGAEFAGAYLDVCESRDLHTAVCRLARPHLPWTGDPLGDRRVADRIAYRRLSYRDLDKRLGHGSNYMGTPRTMAKHAKIPVADATAFQENYFSAFPCIPAYHAWVRRELSESGSLTTLFGRRRCFWGRPNDDATIREAVAYCPQSMTADEIDKGLLALWRLSRVQPLIQVHDSILFQYPEEEEAEIISLALEALRVPLLLAQGRPFVVPAEAKVGWNWGDRTDENPYGLVKWKGSDLRNRPD